MLPPLPRNSLAGGVTQPLLPSSLEQRVDLLHGLPQQSHFGVDVIGGDDGAAVVIVAAAVAASPG